MRPIIRVKNLGKQFRIGRRQNYRTLRESLTDAAKAPLRWLQRRRSETDAGPDKGLIWALKVLTDPFHNIALYYKSPLALLRGELIDPTIGTARWDDEESENAAHLTCGHIQTACPGTP